jgi:predicted PurR-regulated permease PerM
MDETYFKRITSIVILAILIIMTFFLIRPLLLAIVFGIILAFVFAPIYDWLNKKINSKNLSGILICIFLLFIIILPIWFFTPIMIDQSLKVYYSVRDADFVTPLKSIFPSIFASEKFSNDVGQILYSFVSKVTNSIAGYFSSLILNFPILLLQLSIAFFIMFFVLRDKEKFVSYIKSLLPFSKEVEKKIFEQTKGITNSILYGQLVIGVIQGLITGIGFFIFGVPNTLFLTLLACLAGIFPMVGTTIIWVPVVIYLFIDGSVLPGLGVAVFGSIAMFIDNILKPIFVAHRTSLPSSMVLIGMIGGYFLFGILGFILGPLILAYLLIVLDIYRNKRVPGLLIQEKPKRLRISI